MAITLGKVVFQTKNMKSPTVALANVEYHGLIIKGVRILHKKDDPDALFVAMPQTKGKDEKFYDAVFFDSKSLWEDFCAAVLDEWKKQNSKKK